MQFEPSASAALVSRQVIALRDPCQAGGGVIRRPFPPPILLNLPHPPSLLNRRGRPGGNPCRQAAEGPSQELPAGLFPF